MTAKNKRWMLKRSNQNQFFFNGPARRGPLLENTYNAVRVDSDECLMRITRYIHLNHKRYSDWPFCSYGDYLDTARDWIDSAPILDLFSSKNKYKEFVDDHEEEQRTREILKSEMANG